MLIVIDARVRIGLKIPSVAKRARARAAWQVFRQRWRSGLAGGVERTM